MQIGRKIYYELTTGNVILDTGERMGDVVETTEVQDFQMYANLQPYQQSAVGVLQLNFGDYAQNFPTYPYHIDITKNPIDATAIVWDTANPIGATLADAQQAKVAQLNDFYNQTLASGFTSSATGSPLQYAYDSSSQSKFLKLQISVLSGLVTWPVPIPIKGGTIVPHTQAQFQQLLADINTFEWTQQNKLHTLLGQVVAATTVNDVNLITW